MIEESWRFRKAIERIDAANGEDPNHDLDQGLDYPKELLYGRRMSNMLESFAPKASEVVRLAVRAQHIQRWKTPRSSYPMDRQGYLRWRTGLYQFHAETVAEILSKVGYEEGIISRVKAAVGKRDLKGNPDAQLVEDVSGLVFLQHYLAAFASSHPEYDETKWIDIIRKSWQKLSKNAREFVLAGRIQLPAALKPLIWKAVEVETPSPMDDRTFLDQPPHSVLK